MTTQYSLAQVKEHNDNKSTWIVIHNEVYDVTPFLNEHPGGEEVLLEQAGKEASEAFEDVGHSSDARELMVKYKVGEIIPSERTEVKPKNTDWGVSDNKDSSSSQNSLKSWLIPIVLGIIATIVYRAYIQTS
ncbi:cytochrome b5 [Diorhabda carinulata]|uniref:cytochrome b5 n=1 Tax=Diorhabda sublineata TaxID=1163346 RepID=UPI0024E091B0|nr:cytochrome b5 [Diorhabda sublineata]XP_057657900.1 cytochrome b5 [Diorhabda carinulata]